MMKPEELERALLSHDPEERRRASLELREVESNLAVRLLPFALGDDDWRVRKEAVTAASSRAPTGALIGSVLRMLAPGDNVGLRNAAVDLLASWGGPSVDALAGAVGTLDADGRKLAAEALGRSGQVRAVPILKAMSSDPDPNVRLAAVEALAALGPLCLEEVAALLTGFLDSDDPLQQLTALDGLNQLGVVLSWERIEPLLDNPILERPAMLAAGRNRDPRAAHTLAAALCRARGSGWQWALAALAEYVRAGRPLVDAARSSLSRLPESVTERLLEEAVSADEIEVRREALLVLGALGTRTAAETILDAANDDTVAAVAEEALRIAGREAIHALVARARRGDEHERAGSLDILSQVVEFEGQDAVVGAIHLALSEGGPELVGAGLRALSVVSDDTCLSAAARWLAGEAPAALRKAAVAAIASMARKHPDRAVELARAARPEAQDAFFASVVIAALGRPVLGTPEDDQAFLAAALSNDDPAIRRAALDALAVLGDARGVQAAAFALADEEAEVRVSAVRALARMREPDGSAAGLERLIELATKSEDEGLVVAAVRALGDTGDSRVLGVLRPLAHSGAPMAAVAAVEALGSLRDPRHVEALIDALGHPDAEVVKASLAALGTAREPRIIKHLGACLDHEAWSVRRLAADLLGEIGGDAAAAVLRAKCGTEEEPLVREAIQRALGGPEITRTPLRPTPIPGHGSLPPR